MKEMEPLIKSVVSLMVALCSRNSGRVSGIWWQGGPGYMCRVGVSCGLVVVSYLKLGRKFVPR